MAEFLLLGQSARPNNRARRANFRIGVLADGRIDTRRRFLALKKALARCNCALTRICRWRADFAKARRNFARRVVPFFLGEIGACDNWSASLFPRRSFFIVQKRAQIFACASYSFWRRFGLRRGASALRVCRVGIGKLSSQSRESRACLGVLSRIELSQTEFHQRVGRGKSKFIAHDPKRGERLRRFFEVLIAFFEVIIGPGRAVFACRWRDF